jgi:hypothetical protein
VGQGLYLTYLACLTLAYQDYGDEEEYPKVKDFNTHCWHLEHIPRTQIKITMCCAYKAKKVTAKKEKLELTDFS